MPGRLASNGGKVSETSLTPSKTSLSGDVFADLRQVFRTASSPFGGRPPGPFARLRGSRRKRRGRRRARSSGGSSSAPGATAIRSGCRGCTLWPCRASASSEPGCRCVAGLTGAACLDRRLRSRAAAGRGRSRRILLLGFLALFEGFFDRLTLSSLLSATMTASSPLLNASGFLTSATSVSLGNADCMAATAAVGSSPAQGGFEANRRWSRRNVPAQDTPPSWARDGRADLFRDQSNPRSWIDSAIVRSAP